MNNSVLIKTKIKDPKWSAAEIRQYSHHKNVFFENAPGPPFGQGQIKLFVRT